MPNNQLLDKREMGSEQRQTGAVVTGDVNASSRLPENQARGLETLLETCYRDVAAALPGAEVDGFTNFRGDSWQFVVKEPALAVRAALLFRCSLLLHGHEQFGRRFQAATALGFGGIAYLPGKSSMAGGGEAYTASGKRLDRLRRRVPGMGGAGLGTADPFLDCLLGVLDALVRNWTALQAKAVFYALQGFAQAEIARKWQPPISQQAVHKHLSAAGWPAIEPALLWAETIIRDCFLGYNSEKSGGTVTDGT